MKMGSTKVTEGNILRQLIFFSLPLILGNLTQQIYTTLDLMIVGRYADSIAVAAVGSPNSLISLLTGLLNGLGTATGVIISQYYGAGEKDGIRKAVGTSIIWSSSSGIVISVIAIMAAPWLLTLMSTPPEVMPEAVIYFRLYFVGMVFNLTYQMCANILRAV
ncbi:MAG: MATE family efflux transporter, partial [Christensenellaceae bacterium]|nr:MATE family efflux transporter [Christensenellaceae bacterium]